MFSFFKKKNQEAQESHFDPLDIRVIHLENGYLLDYDLETWQVVKMAEYDWGDNYFTREFSIRSGDKLRYLHIEEDEGLQLRLTEDVKYRKLDADYIEKLETGTAPKEIVYEGVLYYLRETAAGYYRNVENEDWEELVSYSYMDAEEELVFDIDQWEDANFELSRGRIIKEKEISNILPIYDED